MAETKEKKTTKKTTAKKTTKPSTPKTTKKATTKKTTKAKKLDIGVDVNLPTKTCDDKHCPFHGQLSVRGQILDGTIVSDKMQNSAVVKREYQRKIEKYERFEKRSSKVMVHNPPCLEAKVGDHVRIMECRPLSKNISYVVIDNLDRR